MNALRRAQVEGQMDLAPFQRLMALAAPDDAPGNVSLIGNDPVYRTRFRIGEAAAMAVGACAALAARAWETRSGREQDIEVNVRAAAASHLSTEYMRLDDKPVPREVTPVAGMFESKDGRWVRLNGLTPRFRRETLAILRCSDDRDSIASAVKKWSALDLEDALAAVAVSGAMIRNADEWASHAQGLAIADLPLVEVIKIGDSPPIPAGTSGRPLGGIRVLDLSLALAGPTAARTLAEHGAVVMRIGAPHLTEYRTSLIDTGHGKLSASLDLRCDADRERLWVLVADADVFSQSFRTGAIARRGFSPEALAAVRPGIVYSSINCYGHEGPWVERAGWEYMAQAVTGIAVDASTPEKPGSIPAPAVDYVTGHLAAFGTMIALLRRAREGGSYHVRVSLCQTAMWLRGLGPVDEADAHAQPANLSSEEIITFSIESDTPFGHLRHLAPVAQLTETPACWQRPTAPIGHDPPSWPQEILP